MNDARLYELTDEVKEIIEQMAMLVVDGATDADTQAQLRGLMAGVHAALSVHIVLPAPIETLTTLWNAVATIDIAMSSPAFAHLEGYQKFEGGKVFLAYIRGSGVIKTERKLTAQKALVALGEALRP